MKKVRRDEGLEGEWWKKLLLVATFDEYYIYLWYLIMRISFREKVWYLFSAGYNGFDGTGNYVGAFLHVFHRVLTKAVYVGWSVYSCATILYDFSLTLYMCCCRRYDIYFAINYKSPSFPSRLNILSWFVWHERRTSMRNDCTIFYLTRVKKENFFRPLPPSPALSVWYILVDFCRARYSKFFLTFC